MVGIWWKLYGRWSLQPWIRTDPGLTELVRWQIFRATFRPAVNLRVVRPFRRHIHRALPHRLAMLRLDLIYRNTDGTEWRVISSDQPSERFQRATDHLDNVQRQATRGHVKLHAGCPMLLDRYGQLLAVDLDGAGQGDLVDYSED